MRRELPASSAIFCSTPSPISDCPVPQSLPSLSCQAQGPPLHRLGWNIPAAATSLLQIPFSYCSPPQSYTHGRNSSSGSWTMAGFSQGRAVVWPASVCMDTSHLRAKAHGHLPVEHIQQQVDIRPLLHERPLNFHSTTLSPPHFIANSNKAVSVHTK